MERYFAKRTGEDFSETQRITATEGHAGLVRHAFVKHARKYEVRDGRSFLDALRELLKELGRLGYTEHPLGWKVTGGKFLPFEKMTLQQIFETWASVQQAIGKWIYNLLPCDFELYTCLIEKELVFKANDACVVMQFVLELLYRPGLKLFVVDLEGGAQNLEKRVLKCLRG